jgi:predicted ATP-dependent endonuclease of OLD family
VYIEQIRLEAFKGFKDFTLNCSPFTTLAGGNSSGKTSILQAVSLLHDFLIFVLGGKGNISLQNP